MEASLEQRETYLKEIENLGKEQLVYVDESGIEIGSKQERGWGPKGQVLSDQKSGKYYQRSNIIAGYHNRKAIAPLIFNGTCNTLLFEEWVAQFLVKELNPGQIVIMDNATFHKSKKIRELIESKGCKLLFLPPYSPDLNPIEKFWANMKRWIKKFRSSFNMLYDALSSFFKDQYSC